MVKPALFVGSSSEGLEFARAMRALLEDVSEATLWNEGVFTLGATFIESLVSALTRFDFAALLLTPDDLLLNRDVQVFGPRDNVIFELGLFMGRLGRERTFVVRPRGDVVKVPLDLAGVTVATYEWPCADRNHQAATGPACDRIREVIRNLSFSPAKVSAHVHAVEVEQQRLDKRINNLVKYGMSASIFHHLCGIALLHEYKYSDEKPFEREMYFLRDNGFIRPKSDAFLDFDYRMNQLHFPRTVSLMRLGA